MAEKKEREEFDFGLGGVFKGVGNLIDMVSKLAEEAKEFKREGEIKLGEKAKGVYGVRVRTLAGGIPKVSTFGNIKRTPKGPVVEEVREPMVDVFDEKDHISVIAEMPGVSSEDIKVKVKGDILKLSAETEDRKYSKEVLLPSKVKGEPETVYKNGILEIKLKKAS